MKINPYFLSEENQVFMSIVKNYEISEFEGYSLVFLKLESSEFNDDYAYPNWLQYLVLRKEDENRRPKLFNRNKLNIKLIPENEDLELRVQFHPAKVSAKKFNVSYRIESIKNADIELLLKRSLEFEFCSGYTKFKFRFSGDNFVNILPEENGDDISGDSPNKNYKTPSDKFKARQDLVSELEENSVRIEDLENEINEINWKRDKQIEELKKEIYEYKLHQNTTYTKKIRAEPDYGEVKQLKGQIIRLQKDLKAKDIEIETQRKNSGKEINDLNSKYDHLRTVNTELEKEQKTLQNEKESIAIELQELKNIEKSASALRRKINTLRERVMTTESELENKKNASSSLIAYMENQLEKIEKSNGDVEIQSLLYENLQSFFLDANVAKIETIERCEILLDELKLKNRELEAAVNEKGRQIDRFTKTVWGRFYNIFSRKSNDSILI